MAKLFSEDEQWLKYYRIILKIMNERYFGTNIHSGYAYPEVRKSYDDKEEYYAFWLSTSNVVPECGRGEWVEDMRQKGFDDKTIELSIRLGSEKKEICLDDLAWLNEELKAAGAEKVYFQQKESYYHGQAALYTSPSH